MTLNVLLENCWKKTGVFTFKARPKEIIERFGEDTRTQDLNICENAISCLLHRLPLQIVYLITFLFARKYLKLGEEMERVRDAIDVRILELDKE